MIFIEVVFLVFAQSVLSHNCGKDVTLSLRNLNYTFSSPNYPNRHGQAWCTWVINAPTAQTMKLECPHLDTVNCLNCNFNYLEYSANGQSTRFCGRGRLEHSDSDTTIRVSFVYPLPFNFWVNGFECTASFTPASTTSPSTPSLPTPSPSTSSPPTSSPPTSSPPAPSPPTSSPPPSSPPISYPPMSSPPTSSPPTPSSPTPSPPMPSPPMSSPPTPSPQTSPFPAPSPPMPSPPALPVPTKCQCGIDRTDRTRIVGGVETELHEFPWMVALRYLNTQYCGGSLISREWVVTAAHCVPPGLELNKVQVSLADHDKSSSNDTDKTKHLNPRKIVRHPEWNSARKRNDIALIQIPRVAITEEISPICLPINSKNISGKKGRTIGWGKIIEGGTTATILKKIEMDLLTASECRKIWNPVGAVTITDNMTCAYNGGTGGVCQGDSGGSLFIKEGIHNFQVGIVSFGAGCARENLPGVFARVESYIDWIKTTTGESFCVK